MQKQVRFICECCGKAYSTREACQKHEKEHEPFQVVCYLAQLEGRKLRFHKVLYDKTDRIGKELALCAKYYLNDFYQYCIPEALLDSVHMRDGAAVVFTADTSEEAEVKYKRALLELLIEDRESVLAELKADLAVLSAKGAVKIPASTTKNEMVYNEFLR